jgi:hypothetical protein
MKLMIGKNIELRSFIKQYIENGGTVLDENFIQAVTERKIPKQRI